MTDPFVPLPRYPSPTTMPDPETPLDPAHAALLDVCAELLGATFDVLALRAACAAHAQAALLDAALVAQERVEGEA